MGDTLKSISQKYGEFPQHIIKKINLSVDECIVVDCQREEILPSVDDIKGIIITGSHSMVTDYEPWSVRISNWLKNIINTFRNSRYNQRKKEIISHTFASFLPTT